MARYQEDGDYIGAWHYVGLEILYAIPVIGWIFLIVHCFIPEKANRMHFARHYFARFLIALVILLIASLVIYLTAGRQYMEHRQEISDVFRQFSERYRDIWDELSDALGKINFN